MELTITPKTRECVFHQDFVWYVAWTNQSISIPDVLDDDFMKVKIKNNTYVAKLATNF